LADQKITVAVAGASGYTGGELIRLLLDHPDAELAFLSSQRNCGVPVGAVHPALRNHPGAAGLKFRPFSEMTDVDIAFGCLPTGALPANLPLLAERAKRVLNLAGDFRLADPREVTAHYPASAKNPAPEPFAHTRAVRRPAGEPLRQSPRLHGGGHAVRAVPAVRRVACRARGGGRREDRFHRRRPRVR
jgi:N-acetyl-gamma-glutamyl-phosphate reductase